MRSPLAFLEALTFEILRTKFPIRLLICIGQCQSVYFQYSLIIAKLSLVFWVIYTLSSSREVQAG